MSLDQTDYKILRKLQEEARITNLQLSNEIGLSPGPTLERVKKLEKNGYIKSYHAKLDNKKLELGIEALIMINLVRQVENAIVDFKKAINELPEVVECYQITGNADYMVKVIVKDIAAFEKLIANHFSKMEQIGQMQTMVVLSKVKESPIAPIDYEQ